MVLDNDDPEGGWVDTHHYHEKVILKFCFPPLFDVVARCLMPVFM